MKLHLRRYQLPVPHEGLPEVLHDSSSHPSEDVGAEVDLGDLLLEFDDLRADRDRTGTGGLSAWDARLCGHLHAALSPVLTRRDACDPRLWHWLATGTRLKEFVWIRWHGLVPADVESALADGDMPARFLGAGSLVGLARNALARLYWTVETLCDGGDPSEGRELARKALQNTDLHLNVFERMVGLHPPAARAAIRVLDDVGEDAHRRALRRLNRLATTMDLELMSEPEIETFLTT